MVKIQRQGSGCKMACEQALLWFPWLRGRQSAAGELARRLGATAFSDYSGSSPSVPRKVSVEYSAKYREVPPTYSCQSKGTVLWRVELKFTWRNPTFLFLRKIVEIARFALRAAILDDAHPLGTYETKMAAGTGRARSWRRSYEKNRGLWKVSWFLDRPFPIALVKS